MPEVFRQYGVNSFNTKTQQEFMAASDFAEFQQCIANRRPPGNRLIEAFSEAVKDWAATHGVTHKTHVFQPLSGVQSEKHDTLFKREKNGTVSMDFRTEHLLSAEPDASSFPNAGLRPTHQARGNVVWDPSSHIFISKLGTAPTLCIPSVFIGWNGTALDYKTPLLRSEIALERAVLNCFKVAGIKGHSRVHSDSGLEQEYFLCKEEFVNAREDLQNCGRTLFGAEPTRGQDHADRYFGTPTTAMLDCQFDIEQELWKLGIPNSTRHREVAPGQYEMAPLFESCNRAVDNNLKMMHIMRQVAQKHHLVALLHEKPYANLNGSGKHNNWSFGTNKIPTLFKPDNPHFLLALAAFVRGVDQHADLLRVSVATAGNDHRLGGHEAPPGIISIYLGDDINKLVQASIRGEKYELQNVGDVQDIGVPGMPVFRRQPVDRNRTSPVAFTGNKFEFRAVGSNQNPSFSSTVLNSITADSFHYLAERIQFFKDKGESDPVGQAVQETLEKHQRILFEGNNYADEWVSEAKSRGLLNSKSTPESLKHFESEKNRALFERLAVMSAEELECRNDVFYDNFCLDLEVEVETILRMANTAILPPVLQQTKILQEAIGDDDPPELVNHLKKIRTHTEEFVKNVNKLQAKHTSLIRDFTGPAKAEFIQNEIRPIMQTVRLHSDTLETLIDAQLWRLPSYNSMVNVGHN